MSDTSAGRVVLAFAVVHSYDDLPAGMVSQHVGDLDRIMDTFADDCVMQYNQLPFQGDEGIRGAHILIGMSSLSGAFSGLRNIIDEEHCTDEETVVEGRLVGEHSNEFLGFAATERDVELPFVAF